MRNELLILAKSDVSLLSFVFFLLLSLLYLNLSRGCAIEKTLNCLFIGVTSNYGPLALVINRTYLCNEFLQLAALSLETCPQLGCKYSLAHENPARRVVDQRGRRSWTLYRNSEN
jgi:hypothetical protein